MPTGAEQTGARAAATLAAAATGVLVGAAMVSTRAVSDQASPATLAFLRYLVGAAILLVPVLLGPTMRFTRRDAVGIGVLGIGQFAALIVLLNYALANLSASTCALVFSTMPVITLFIGMGIGRDSYGHARLLGLVLAVGGVGLLLYGDLGVLTASAATVAPLAALVGATVLGAVCSVLYRPYLLRYPALPTSGLAMLVAVVFLAGLCLATSQPLLPPLTTTGWLNVAFIGAASGFGYFCWLWALGRIEPSSVVAFQALGPVTATAIELVWLREWPSLAQLASVVLVTAGLLLAVRRPKPALPA